MFRANASQMQPFRRWGICNQLAWIAALQPDNGKLSRYTHHETRPSRSEPMIQPTTPRQRDGHEPQDGFIGLVGPVWRRRDNGRLRFGFLAGQARQPRRRRGRHADDVRRPGARHAGLGGSRAGRGDDRLRYELRRFLGRIGSFIELDGKSCAARRSSVFLRGTLLAGKRILATCQGTWKILRRSEPARKGADA